jgi:hypothetical protein
VTASPRVSVDHLRLELVHSSGEGSRQEIELHLIDSVGVAIMTFMLPENIAHALKADRQEWQITMSPSGLVEVYDVEKPPRQPVSMELDELIKQSLTPDMLEDEAGLKRQLAVLRIKLEKALALVDQTILSLPKQKN